ncbi:FecR family protein [Sphingobium phenoxybenzoativorans]|uniref:FecR family protein n=1 Tax=Sphingobium phenoxybenzoativorans TaxID=1592790 RepID=UPI0009F5F7AF|nr:FecR domain-containing protein [Sphingobium phenoxybenzoativorans]
MAKGDPAKARIERATELFARLQNEGATGEDREAAAIWRREAAENEQAWQEVAALWAFLGEARHEPLLASMRVRTQNNIASVPASAASRRWLPMALAACLIGLICAPAIWWSLHQKDDPGVKAAPAMARDGYMRQIYASDVGQRRIVSLSDGSTIELNSGSEVMVAFSSHRRDVRLVKGQALFSVSKDKSRPFVVDTGALKVIAVGTAFDVRRGRDGADITTMEGLVRVEPHVRSAALQPTLVPAGSKLSMLCDTLKVGKVDVRKETIWTKGLIVFDGRCLSDVAEEMNRYSQRKLTVSTSAANLTINGTFQASNALAFARTLQQQGLVEMDDTGREIRLSAQSPAVMTHALCRRKKI